MRRLLALLCVAVCLGVSLCGCTNFASQDSAEYMKTSNTLSLPTPSEQLPPAKGRPAIALLKPPSFVAQSFRMF